MSDYDPNESEAKRVAREGLEKLGFADLEKSDDTPQRKPHLMLNANVPTDLGDIDAPPEAGAPAVPAPQSYSPLQSNASPTMAGLKAVGRGLLDYSPAGIMAHAGQALAPSKETLTSAARVFDPAYGKPVGTSGLRPATSFQRGEPDAPMLAAGSLASPAPSAAPAPAPGLVFRKGLGWVPMQRSVQRTEYGPQMEESERQRQASAGNAIAGQQLETEGEREANQLVASMARQKAVADDAYQSGLVHAAQRRRAVYDSTIADISAARQKVAEAGDAPGYFEQNSTGAGITAGIGLLLSGLGLRMGPAIMQMLQMRSEADAREKYAKLTGAKASLGAALEKADLEKGRAGEESAQLEAIRAANYQKIINEIQAQMAASPNDKMIQGAGQKAIAMFEDKASQAAQNAAKMTASQVSVNEHFDRGGYIGSTAKSGDVFAAPDGQKFQARNAESRKKLAEGAATRNEVQSLAKDYAAALKDIGLSDKAGHKVGYNTEAMSRAQTAYANLLGRVRQANNDGVWKKSEVELLENTLAPPQNFSGNPEVQLRLIDKQSNDAWRGLMRAEDPMPINETPVAPGVAPRVAPTGDIYRPPATSMPAGSRKVGP